MNETIVLGSKQYTITRSKLKRWIELESLKTKTLDFAKRGRAMEFCDNILSYVSICTGVEIDELDKLPWTEIVFTWQRLLSLNTPNLDIPIYAVQNLDDKKKPVWDYEGRTWYTWVHDLAHEYGWTIEYIAELDIDDASSLLQELIINDQLDKEFHWMSSEVAYPYNESSKKGEFKPLQRPVWMMEQIRSIKEGKDQNIRILKEHLPVGNIIKLYKDSNAKS